MIQHFQENGGFGVELQLVWTVLPCGNYKTKYFPSIKLISAQPFFGFDWLFDSSSLFLLYVNMLLEVVIKRSKNKFCEKLNIDNKFLTHTFLASLKFFLFSDYARRGAHVALLTWHLVWSNDSNLFFKNLKQINTKIIMIFFEYYYHNMKMMRKSLNLSIVFK